MSTIDPHNEDHADGIVEDRKQAPPVYFTLLFYGLILWGVLFMGWYLFSGWSSHDEFTENMAAHTGTPAVSQTAAPAPAATEAPAAPAAAAVDAAALYAARCAGCHGATGEGAFGPDLTAGSYKYGRDREAVHSSIANGRPKSMPGFAGSLSAGEIDALTTYILDL